MKDLNDRIFPSVAEHVLEAVRQRISADLGSSKGSFGTMFGKFLRLGSVFSVMNLYVTPKSFREG